MRGSANVDNAGRGAGFQRVEQQVSQKKVIQMIESQGHLDPVHAMLAGGEKRPGVVHQHMQVLISARKLLRQLTNLFLCWEGAANR